jgi:hypothetical protein
MRPPIRYKDREDWSPAEIHRHRHEGAKPETDEYRRYVREVHEAAGLDIPESAAESVALEDMTPEQHATRKRPR